MALVYYYYPTDKTLIQGWRCTVCEWKWLLSGATPIADVTETTGSTLRVATSPYLCSTPRP